MGNNLIADIFISLFAVYGFYAVVRELCRLVLGKEKFLIAIEVKSASDVQTVDSRIGASAALASYERRLECMPVILVSNNVDDEQDVPQKLKDKGLRIFVEKIQENDAL